MEKKTKYSVQYTDSKGRVFESDPIYANSFKEADKELKRQGRLHEVITGKIVNEICIKEKELNNIVKNLKENE